MKRTLDKAVERWLAEEAGASGPVREAAAEAALAEVFRRWPSALPPAGFALAVLRRAGLAEPRRDVFRSRWLHALIAAAFVLAALSVALLPLGARVARLVLGPGELVELASRGLVAAGHLAAGALDLWGFLNRFGAAVGAVVATPQVALTLFLVALCAGGALRTLDRLITAERSS